MCKLPGWFVLCCYGTFYDNDVLLGPIFCKLGIGLFELYSRLLLRNSGSRCSHWSLRSGAILSCRCNNLYELSRWDLPLDHGSKLLRCLPSRFLLRIHRPFRKFG